MSIIFLVFVMYLLMIMPRMVGKPDVSELKKWMYAHRGLHDNASDAPENSMAAFQRAVEVGYGIEMDIQLTKDRVPVVFHDFTLKRVCGVEGNVKDYTYEQLQQFTLYHSKERIPRFEDVLCLVDGKVPLIVEFKIPGKKLGICPVADKLLGEYKGLYCVESFHPLCLWWYRRHHRNVIRGQLSEDFWKEKQYRSVLHFMLQNLLFNFLAKPDFVAYNHKHRKNLSRTICGRWYRNMAVAWTIRSEEELEESRKHFDVFIFDSFLPKEK